MTLILLYFLFFSLLFSALFNLLYPNLIYFSQYVEIMISGKESILPISSLRLALPLEKSRESENPTGHTSVDWLTVIIDLVSSVCVCVCVTDISEPAVDAPSFSLWFNDCRLLLELLITSPTAFDMAEPQKGITAVRRVRRATASVKHPQERCCVAAIAANPSRKWPPQPRLLNVSNYWHWQIWWCCPVARVWISSRMTERRRCSNVNSMRWK